MKLIKILSSNNGICSATWNVSTQGTAGIPIETVKFEDNVITLSSSLHLSYRERY